MTIPDHLNDDGRRATTRPKNANRPGRRGGEADWADWTLPRREVSNGVGSEVGVWASVSPAGAVSGGWNLQLSPWLTGCRFENGWNGGLGRRCVRFIGQIVSQGNIFQQVAMVNNDSESRRKYGATVERSDLLTTGAD